MLALILVPPLLIDYLDNGMVPRLPTAILPTNLAIVSLLIFAAGINLDSLTRAHREMRRFAYLVVPLHRTPKHDAQA